MSSPESGFQCNICGRRNDKSPGEWDREVPSCSQCGSTIRTRSIMQVLSEELFGVTIPVSEFPRLKGIRGIGTSDSEDYAALLAARFDYKNTWYHREPKFDITDISDSDEGQYDFVITSEVLEHVSPPVERVFANLFRLLKPHGILVMTVPFVQSEATAEHFPNLHDFTIAELSDRLVLVNRTREGRLEVHENLVFHGGPGSTLELRLFAEQHLRECLRGAGFSSAQFYPGPAPEWGILHPGSWSLPLAARKLPFALSKDCTSEWAVQWRAGLERIRKQDEEIAYIGNTAGSSGAVYAELVERTEWAQRLDRELAAASERVRTLQRELEERTEWARSLDRDVQERTAWALGLEGEIRERDESIRALQADAEALRRERDQLAAQAGRLRGGLMLRALRKMGL